MQHCFFFSINSVLAQQMSVAKWDVYTRLGALSWENGQKVKISPDKNVYSME